MFIILALCSTLVKRFWDFFWFFRHKSAIDKGIKECYNIYINSIAIIIIQQTERILPFMSRQNDMQKTAIIIGASPAGLTALCLPQWGKGDRDSGGWGVVFSLAEWGVVVPVAQWCCAFGKSFVRDEIKKVLSFFKRKESNLYYLFSPQPLTIGSFHTIINK